MDTLALAQRPQVGAERIYYIDEGHHLRAVHCVMQPNGKFRPSGVEERVSFPLVQAAIAKAEGRPDMHPTELGYNELGAGAVRKKVKTVAKKVAKSKVLKKVAKIGMGIATAVTAVVPGTQGLAAALVVAQVGMKAAGKAKAAKKAVKGVAKAVKPKKGAKKAAHPAAVAAASVKLRASVKPTSSVASTPAAAMLREQRIDEAAKALATVPPEEHAAAIDTIANRLDGYKVLTPKGNTVWVSADAIA